MIRAATRGRPYGYPVTYFDGFIFLSFFLNLWFGICIPNISVCCYCYKPIHNSRRGDPMWSPGSEWQPPVRLNVRTVGNVIIVLHIHHPFSRRGDPMWSPDSEWRPPVRLNVRTLGNIIIVLHIHRPFTRRGRALLCPIPFTYMILLFYPNNKTNMVRDE